METERTPRGPLDLSAFVDWRGEFARRGASIPEGKPVPLEVEIGSGAGGFALGHAAAHPNLLLVAMEIRKKLARETEEKAQKRGLSNLIVLSADAKTILPRLFAKESVSTFHIQFPDPWWKKRHHGRRLVDDEMSILLYNLLEKGGTVKLRTDVEKRGEEMALALEAVGFANRFGPGNLAPYDPGEVPSSREKGYLERGEPIYRYVMERRDAPPHFAEEPLPETSVGMENRRK